MDDFDLAGTLRRIRRTADVSQRELAAACALSPAAVGHAEAGRRGLGMADLVRAAGVAGLRLALVDADGRVVPPMRCDTVRDGAERLFPAHLDPRHGDVDWWGDDAHHGRERPWYTVDRDRVRRDRRRAEDGPADDHRRPRPEDDPQVRDAARRLRLLHDRIRRQRAGRIPGPAPEEECRCGPECERECAPTCRCRCGPGGVFPPLRPGTTPGPRGAPPRAPTRGGPMPPTTDRDRLARAFDDVAFPADKDALVEGAVRNGADDDTVRALRAIPAVDYRDIGEVLASVQGPPAEEDRPSGHQPSPIVEELGENRGS